MSKKQERIPTTEIILGACYNCPKEIKGDRPNPPVNPVDPGKDGRAQVVCMAQGGEGGREMATRTDIEDDDYTQCLYYQASEYQ